MKNKIQNLINKARKERDYTHLSTYQTILASIQEREARENVDLNDDQIFSVIEKEKKLFEESADIFADKHPLESKTYRIKAQICADLLPEQIDESEYENIIWDSVHFVGAVGIKDMGKVMKHIKQEYGKTVDASKISVMVKEQLKNQVI
jgi:uncharacterized protein YqeY